jgi:hypothetical protein
MQSAEDVAAQQVEIQGYERPFIFPEMVIEEDINKVDDVTSSALSLLTPADMRSVGKAIGETNKKLQEPLYHSILAHRRVKSSSSRGRRRDHSKELLQPVLRSIRNSQPTANSHVASSPLLGQATVDHPGFGIMAKMSKPDSPAFFSTPPTSVGNTTPVTPGGGRFSNYSTPPFPDRGGTTPRGEVSEKPGEIRPLEKRSVQIAPPETES